MTDDEEVINLLIANELLVVCTREEEVKLSLNDFLLLFK